MPVNKVIYGENTLIDLSEDTVEPDTLMKGVTAHDKNGNVITGTGDFVSEAMVLEADY